MGQTDDAALQRKDQRKGKQRAQQGWLGFVEVSLTAEDKEALQVAYATDGALLDFMQEVVDDGYKLSVSFDASHSCYVATLTGRGDTCPNNGLSLSGRGPSLGGSVACVAYKHVELCGRGKWARAGGSSEASAFA